MAFVDQLAQLALAGHDIGQVEAAEFILFGQRLSQQTTFGQLVQQPVIERPLILELECADAVRDALERVFDRMRKGVHRVDAPLVARVVMGGAADAVQRRVAQIDIRGSHVDLGAQHHRAVGMQAVAHLAQAGQIVLRAAAAEWAVHAGRGEVAATGAHFLGGLLIDISQASADQVFGGAVHEVEIIAGKEQMRSTGAG